MIAVHHRADSSGNVHSLAAGAVSCTENPQGVSRKIGGAVVDAWETEHILFIDPRAKLLAVEDINHNKLFVPVSRGIATHAIVVYAQTQLVALYQPIEAVRDIDIAEIRTVLRAHDAQIP